MAPRTATTVARNEEIARQLKRDGYNSSVIASKMIREHDMTEEAATAMVGQLFGKKVSARTGDTTVAVLSGAAIAAVGVLGTLTLLWADVGGSVRNYYLAAGLGFVGTGLTRIIIALVNINAKDDLRARRS